MGSQEGRETAPRLTAYRLVMLLAVVALAPVIVWIDIATGLWQEAVILSGIAAGLLTFLLTALVIERIISQTDHRRWYPVTRLALTDLLHALADEDRSEISRGRIEPRLLPQPAALDQATAEAILADIRTERERLTVALARWANFLAASADVRDLMTHVAVLAERLDLLRDDIVEAHSRAGSLDDAGRALRDHIAVYNDAMTAAVNEIEQILTPDVHHRGTRKAPNRDDSGPDGGRELPRLDSNQQPSGKLRALFRG